MWSSCNNLITLVSQRFHTTQTVFMPNNIHPFLGSHSNLFVDIFAETLFDYIELLNSKNFTTTHDSTCVVQLVHVFYCNRKMLRTVAQHFYKPLFPFFGDYGF